MNTLLKAYNAKKLEVDSKFNEIEDNIFTFYDSTKANANGKTLNAIEKANARKLVKEYVEAIGKRLTAQKEYLT
jgi:hypothetical protein